MFWRCNLKVYFWVLSVLLVVDHVLSMAICIHYVSIHYPSLLWSGCPISTVYIVSCINCLPIPCLFSIDSICVFCQFCSCLWTHSLLDNFLSGLFYKYMYDRGFNLWNYSKYCLGHWISNPGFQLLFSAVCYRSHPTQFLGFFNREWWGWF